MRFDDNKYKVEKEKKGPKLLLPTLETMLFNTMQALNQPTKAINYLKQLRQ